ncbi:tRNA-splicing endonuclease subunit Sen15-like [Dendronephthya gigantea]|uniref:tRNA-splicing endonuclease subunit Sen15-like n=1 Tax=Dendronephthya gigantea TaxID=151771 RepID=UPI00106B7023|nr:tRNA-splicing endonuclease subunit Sen15-like [Dendronephthya gigantea]
MAECPIVETSRENWFEGHPKYLEMMGYGYNVSLRQAMLVYLDLIEVKHWFDVELCRCDAIKNVYIVGRPLKKCQIELVVPTKASNAFTHADIHTTITEVCRAFRSSELGNSVGETEIKSVYFAIIDSSSTVVYYKMTAGLVSPDEVGDDDAEADSLIRWKKNNKKRQNKS